MNNTLTSECLEKLELYGISPEDFPMEKYSQRTIESLKSSIRAINLRIENLHMDAAQICGVLPLAPGKIFWTIDDINWDDQKLQETKIFENLQDLADKKYKLNNVVDLREGIENNNVDWVLARHKAYSFGRNYTTEELTTFFKQHGLTRGFFSLTQKLVENPNFLEGVIL